MDTDIQKRIINLRIDQITALFGLVGIVFDKKDLPNIAKEVKKNGKDSVYLGTLLGEANNRKNLEWWINYFESKK